MNATQQAVLGAIRANPGIRVSEVANVTSIRIGYLYQVLSQLRRLRLVNPSSDATWGQCFPVDAARVIEVEVERDDAIAELRRLVGVGGALRWFNRDGSPRDGYRLREEVLAAQKRIAALIARLETS